MKTRNSFVSNSSASSFVCAVCGDIASGWDGHYDRETTYFSCGHETCTNCMPKSISKVAEELAEKSVEELKALMPDLHIEIGEIEEVDQDERVSWLEDFICEDGVLDICCPICNFDTIPDSVVLEYALEKLNVDRAELEDEIRKRWPTEREWNKRHEVP